ncbi:MAG: hypothetical protein J7M12_06730, partial [Candidatus Hydrogenedentes bacterium]|nr:hypothetical protein [Candidatus Hydrogenedentota bacterium]
MVENGYRGIGKGENMETHGDGLIEQFQWFTVKSPLLITFIILAGVLFVVAVLVEYFRQRMVARARV